MKGSFPFSAITRAVAEMLSAATCPSGWMIHEPALQNSYPSPVPHL